MAYNLKISVKAKKQLDKLVSSLQKRILDYLEEILDDPFSSGKALSGSQLKGLWRYRVGEYRLICDIRKNQLIITVVKIGHRSSVYK